MAHKAEAVSKKNLVFWPVLFLFAGLVWAQAPTQPGTPLPTPAPIPSIAPTPQIQPTLTTTPVQPTATPIHPPQTGPKVPVASAPVPEEHGHWVFIPDKGQPNLPPGYSIPPASNHH